MDSTIIPPKHVTDREKKTDPPEADAKPGAVSTPVDLSLPNIAKRIIAVEARLGAIEEGINEANIRLRKLDALDGVVATSKMVVECVNEVSIIHSEWREIRNDLKKNIPNHEERIERLEDEVFPYTGEHDD